MSISYIQEVLQVEAQAILNLISLINEDFATAINWIKNCNGRIIVSGMGKSGLIGQKISATFSSTGTPSLSLHPAEAIHGDLGRVIKNDILLALSNGGETSEIINLIPGVKKIGARIIGITASKSSSLGKLSDLVLAIGKVEEACPLGLAPTASTTVMLAVGDALAMTVSKERNFTREEYALYHPGGSLGRKLMKVSEIMRIDNAHPCVPKTMLIKDVLFAITKARAGAATIIDEQGKVCGIFTDGDLRRYIEHGKDINLVAVEQVMICKPITVSPETMVVEALRILKEKKIDEVPVIDADGKSVGMLDVQDLLEIGWI